MGGGAWPFLVGGVICLVNSDNERDLNLLNSGYHVWNQSKAGGMGCVFPFWGVQSRLSVLVPKDLVYSCHFLEGLLTSSQWKFEAITGL
jgi:hypothetical protein